MANENVIQATFDGFYKTYTEPSWFIDHGMELSISGIDLPDEFECHFSNSRSVAAKRQIGENGVVTIPDEYFLSNAAQIFCWIYLHPTVDSGVTEYEIVIPLRPRPNVDPAEPTQEQQDIVDQAIAALNVAMEATSTDAENAAASASAALASERAAQAAAEQAAQTLESYAKADTIASVYSYASTYDVGDYAYHGGVLYRCTTAITTAEAWTAAHWTAVTLGDDVADLKSALNDTTESEPLTRQLFDKANANIFKGYSNGLKYFSSNAHRIAYIPCEPLTEYTVSADNTLWVSNSVFQSENAPDNNVDAMSFASMSTTITVVENGRKYFTQTTDADTHYLAILYYNTNVTQQTTEDGVLATIMVAKGAERTQYYAYKEQFSIKETALPELIQKVAQNPFNAIVSKLATLDSENGIEEYAPNIKKNAVLGFSANITTFTDLVVGQGKTAMNQTAYLVIDDTNVNVYRYTTEPIEWISLPHGLTIQDYINVTITQDSTRVNYAKISITSNGDTYNYSNAFWQGCGDYIYANTTGSTFTNAVLSYGCRDIEKEVWMFGDSYFDHWIDQALTDGFKNFLCDGWSGRKAQQGVRSLNQLVSLGKPRTIVWCLGMNDSDSSTAINVDWGKAYNSVISICSENNITPIFCTIPNTPTQRNTFKNTLIRDSGFNYIDLAKFVGADTAGSTWYSGLLSNDNVHPSTVGDVVIAKFMESSLPQIYGE